VLRRDALFPDSIKATIPEWAEEAVCISTGCAGESLRGMSGACQRADCGAALRADARQSADPRPGAGLAVAGRPQGRLDYS